MAAFRGHGREFVKAWRLSGASSSSRCTPTRGPGRRVEVVDQFVDVHAVVPDVELGRLGVAPHACGVGLDGRGHRQRARLGLMPSWRAATTRLRQPLHVPLERAGQCSSKSRKSNERFAPGWPTGEVEDVRVAAELHLEPAVGHRGEVGGHDGGRPSVVVPRRQAMRSCRMGSSSGTLMAFWRGASRAHRDLGHPRPTRPAAQRGMGASLLPLARRSVLVAARSWCPRGVPERARASSSPPALWAAEGRGCGSDE